MKYSEDTHKLIQRMERVALRQEFVFDKKEITKLVKQSYELFKLPIPKIEWCRDITDERFLGAARDTGAAGAAWAARAARDTGAARAAGAAGAAWAAWAARDTGAAWAAGAAGAAWAAWDTGAAGAAGAARAARAAWAARDTGAAGAAGAARAARAASDYDQDWYVITHEFAKENEINDNDRLVLKAQELFLQAKEAGMGYWAEQDGILYVCPNPIIRLKELRYHSEDRPAIEWKNGLKLYHLFDVNFEHDLWRKVVSGQMTFKDITALQNIEQRMAAFKFYNADKLLKDAGAKLIDKSERGNELYLVENIFRRPTYFLRYECPSTGRVYVSAIDDREAFKTPEDIKADVAMGWKFSLTPLEYSQLAIEA